MGHNFKHTRIRSNAFLGGFSLIELLVVIAIIGILASIAIPQYSNYIRRSKLADGTAALAAYRVTLEQYYQDNRSYGTAGGTCTNSTLPGPNSANFTFVCTVGAAPADTYVLTATSIPGQGLGATAGYFTYTLTQLAKGTTSYNGTSYAAGVKPCWLISGGEC